MTSDPTAPDLAPAPQRVGQYLLLEKVGQGGMGAVFRARHLSLGRIVALKILPTHRSHDPVNVARFRHEMAAVGRLAHPNVVSASDAGEADGYHYLAMDFVAGVDLSRLLLVRDRLAAPDACELARQTALALQYIHDNGLIHRDVKPSNLMLDLDGNVKLLDLGLARGPAAEGLTFTGQLLGTGDFMSPEQGLESRTVDIRTDVYSLGCTLFALLAGRPPFHGPAYASMYEKIKAHVEVPAPPLGDACPDAPAGLVAVVARMLAKRPEVRYATPAEAAAALAPFTAGCDLVSLVRSAYIRPAEGSADGDTITRQEDASAAAPSAAFAPTVDPIRPPPRRRLLSIVLFVLAVAIVIVLFLATGGYLGPGRHRGEPGGGPAVTVWPDTMHLVPEPRTFTAGVWTDLLDRPPVALDWPDDGGKSHFEYLADRKELRASCLTAGLLELGRVEAPEFEFELTLVQNPWIGGMGAFYRHRDVKPLAGPELQYRFVRLDNFRSELIVDKAGFSLADILAVPPPGEPIAEFPGSASIKRMFKGEHTLTLRVGRAGLRSVAWDGAELPELLKLPQAAGPPDGAGAFGLYLGSSHAELKRARIFIKE